jgi:hypothetical protein
MSRDGAAEEGKDAWDPEEPLFSLVCVGLLGWAAVSAARADELPVTDKIPASTTKIRCGL